MSARMPEPLARYFTAFNSHDIDAMVGCFADDAVVRDERQEHRGTVAIRRWIEDTTARYRATVEVIEVTVDAKTSVAGLVSGTFPGSPVRLRYDFTLAGQEIARLEIG